MVQKFPAAVSAMMDLCMDSQGLASVLICSRRWLGCSQQHPHSVHELGIDNAQWDGANPKARRIGKSFRDLTIHFVYTDIHIHPFT